MARELGAIEGVLRDGGVCFISGRFMLHFITFRGARSWHALGAGLPTPPHRRPKVSVRRSSRPRPCVVGDLRSNQGRGRETRAQRVGFMVEHSLASVVTRLTLSRRILLEHAPTFSVVESQSGGFEKGRVKSSSNLRLLVRARGTTLSIHFPLASRAARIFWGRFYPHEVEGVFRRSFRAALSS